MPAPASPSTDHRQADQDHLTTVFSEFCQVADRLAMPFGERVGIAGLSVPEWHRLSAGSADLPVPTRARCLRRLNYSLPLLHKLLTHHNGAGHTPHGQAPPPLDIQTN